MVKGGESLLKWSFCQQILLSQGSFNSLLMYHLTMNLKNSVPSTVDSLPLIAFKPASLGTGCAMLIQLVGIKDSTGGSWKFTSISTKIRSLVNLVWPVYISPYQHKCRGG